MSSFGQSFRSYTIVVWHYSCRRSDTRQDFKKIIYIYIQGIRTVIEFAVANFNEIVVVRGWQNNNMNKYERCC